MTTPDWIACVALALGVMMFVLGEAYSRSASRCYRDGLKMMDEANQTYGEAQRMIASAGIVLAQREAARNGTIRRDRRGRFLPVGNNSPERSVK